LNYRWLIIMWWPENGPLAAMEARCALFIKGRKTFEVILGGAQCALGEGFIVNGVPQRGFVIANISNELFRCDIRLSGTVRGALDTLAGEIQKIIGRYSAGK